MKRFSFSLRLFVILFWGITYSVTALPANKEQKLSVKEWLQLGPIVTPLPAFHDTPNLQGKTVKIKNILNFSLAGVKDWRPSAAQKFQWDKSTILEWRAMPAINDTLTITSAKTFHQPHVYYLAAYLQTGRFIRAKIKFASNTLFKAFVDGQSIAQKTSADTLYTKATSEITSQKVNLETGKHLLLIKLMIPPQQKPTVQLSVQITLPTYANLSDVTISLNPKEIMTTAHLLDGKQVTALAVSPDGQWVALTLRRALPPSDKSENWLEIRRLKDGQLVRTFRGGMKIGRIKWAPVGQKFAYVSLDKDKRTLWVYDFQTEKSMPLLHNIKDLGGFTWAPDGSFLIYSISEEPPKNKIGLKRLEGMEDRWPWWRDRSFLYKVNFPSGSKMRLTAGRLSTHLNSISPDGQHLIFTRTLSDYKERPYSKIQYFILNLKNLSVDSLWTVKWEGSAQWSPNGRYLLLTGGPSMFNGLGINLPPGVTPNDYDTQAYLYDFRSKKIMPITKNFNPAINQGFWGEHAKCIYFVTTDHSYRNLYAFDLREKTFKKINTGGEVIKSFSKAAHNSIAVAVVSGASQPPEVMAINLNKKTHHLLLNPEKETFAHVQFGKVQRWTFVNKRGTEIEGRVYFPPNFSPEKKYPCIVYYYGGTSPVSRDFGGRYPKELWAANGYVVYVLQPSGATGFGQAFSALHVNDWGKIVADEIIDGSKKFLKAHSFVDSTKVGCIGASYGGFMTMTLVTKTHLFKAAVAHAGISSISSYWGQGYWGYLYSAVATANSFPWNRRDIYVNRSPLFNAQKITTPLLLLHGTADTNVPTGESIQLYTALKLLGKTVELVEIKGQNHHIMAYGKRKLWTKTIIAWFDRWLKGQPEWWNVLYPSN